jgi:hypothetical protein
VFFLALGVYGFTLAPGVIWGDSATFAVQVHDRRIYFGTAGDHPLYLLLGVAFSALPGELARNLNELSAVCAAAAVAVVFATVVRLTDSLWSGAVAAAALGFAHAFWLHAVITEVYSLNSLCLALAIAFALEWERGGPRVWLLGAFGALAVGITNHLVLGTLVPALLFLIVAVRSRRLRDRRVWLALAGAAAAAALALAFVDPVRDAFLRVWLGPPPIWHYFAFRTDPRDFARECGYYALYLAYQFPLAGLALGALGIADLLRTRRRVDVPDPVEKAVALHGGVDERRGRALAAEECDVVAAFEQADHLPEQEGLRPLGKRVHQERDAKPRRFPPRLAHRDPIRERRPASPRAASP